MNIKEQFLGAIAFAGDLTMGQPPEHSPTTACLAAKIAELDGASPSTIARAAQLGMIRWGGCTANADGFASLFGDDILGRREVLAARDPFVAKPMTTPSLMDSITPYLPFVPKQSAEAVFYGKVMPLVYSHCEVAGEIARRAKLSPELISAIDDLFEYWDGSGWPKGKTRDHFDPCVQYVWLANDIEAFCRFHGPDEAGRMIRSRGNVIYEGTLADRAVPRMSTWLAEIRENAIVDQALVVCSLDDTPQAFDLNAAVLLLADFSDLKRPRFAGVSRLASDIADRAARALALDQEDIANARQGVLLSTLGYVSVTSAAFGRENHQDMESIRLVPYWTERILSRMPEISEPQKIAVQVFERLDGSGWHKGLTAADLKMPARIAQAAMVAAETMVRNVESTPEDELIAAARIGHLDPRAVEATLDVLGVATKVGTPKWVNEFDITQREREVLTNLIRGKSNKEIARALSISPKTVGTHLENCYRKMGVTTRAAAAIKALDAGLVAL